MGCQAGKQHMLSNSDIPQGQAVELGTIRYVNLTKNQKHGELEVVLAMARESGRPIFANFVEWRG